MTILGWVGLNKEVKNTWSEITRLEKRIVRLERVCEKHGVKFDGFEI